jgi:hypothetical protein
MMWTVRSWLESFGVAEESLASVGDALPRHLSGEELHARVLAEALLHARSAWSDVRPEDARRLIESGDLGAAARVLEKLQGGEEQTSLLAEIRRRRSEAERVYERARIAVEASLGDLHKLDVPEVEIAKLKEQHDRAASFATRERWTLATRLETETEAAANARVSDIARQLQLDIDALRPRIEALVDEQKDRGRRRLDRATEFLRALEVRLAGEAIRQARRILEGGTDEGEAWSSEPARPQLRRLPQGLTIEWVHEFLQNPDASLVDLTEDRRAAFLACLPNEWAKRPIARDPRTEAIRDLMAARKRPPGRTNIDGWRNFFRNLFDVLSARGFEPSFPLDEVVIRKEKDEIKSGFFAGRCSPKWHVPGSFLNSTTLPQGLPVVVWFRPGMLVRPGNLERASFTRGPFLVVSAEPVPSQLTGELAKFERAALFQPDDILPILLAERPHEAFAEALASRMTQPPNPYQSSGIVSGAMFFGREREIAQLAEVNGPHIIYGGRKLGKSSLLREWSRRYQEGDPYRVSVVLDIRNAGAAPGTASNVLQQIVEHLKTPGSSWYNHPEGKTRGPFADLKVTGSPADFERQIRALVARFPKHRFLILLDEADQFLRFLNVPEGTQDEERRIGWMLRSLVQDLQDRFDVRFAGFQDIDRAARDTSGPFFNFRAAATTHLPLGVLQAPEARALVERPMALLGISFERDLLVDRILDYSGRHPALIQEFCRELVDAVQRGGKKLITSAMVERVFDRNEFRDRLVQLIRLNVEGENHQKRILKLALLTWVTEIANPARRPTGEARELFSSAEVHAAIASFLGEKIDEVLSVAELDLHLRDLTVLGVLKDEGRNRYSLANRYFAQILQDPARGEDLADQILRAWLGLVSDRESGARDTDLVGEVPAALPISKRSHELLMRQVLPGPEAPKSARLAAVVGPAATRKLLIHRVRRTFAASGYRIVDVDPKGPELRASDLDARWSKLDDISTGGGVLAVVRADALSGATLFASANDGASTVEVLAEATRNHELAVVFDGGYRLAQELSEWSDLTGVSVLKVGSEPLAEAELSAWLDMAKLEPQDENARVALWTLSGGDLRVLGEVHRRLTRGEEVAFSAAQVEAMRTAMREEARKPGSWFSAAMDGYAPEDRERLGQTYALLRELGAGPLDTLAGFLAEVTGEKVAVCASFLAAALDNGDLVLEATKVEPGQRQAEMRLFGPVRSVLADALVG